MQTRREHASHRYSIIRVRLQATRREIRDLLTPVVDGELVVDVRVPSTPRKTPLIRRRPDNEVGHYRRGDARVSNRDTAVDSREYHCA